MQFARVNFSCCNRFSSFNAHTLLHSLQILPLPQITKHINHGTPPFGSYLELRLWQIAEISKDQVTWKSRKNENGEDLELESSVIYLGHLSRLGQRSEKCS